MPYAHILEAEAHEAELKTCSKCGIAKAATAFSIDKSHADGLASQCKPCRAASERARRAQPEVKEQYRQYYQDNRDQFQKRKRQWRKDNRAHETAYIRNRIRNTKATLIEERGGACERCGYNAHYGALQFHHRDPSQKEFEIGHRLSRSIDSLRNEAQKCDLLCANCHIVEHCSW